MGYQGYSLTSHVKRQARGLPVALELNPFGFTRTQQFHNVQESASRIGRLYGSVRDDADVFDITQQELDALQGFAQQAAIRLFAAQDAFAPHPGARKQSKFPETAAATLANLARVLGIDSVIAMRAHLADDIRKLYEELHPPTEQAEPAELTA